MLIIPMYWTVMTVAAESNINLPTAYAGSNQAVEGDGTNRPQQQNGPGSSVSEEMLAYLQENTADMKYLLAVPSSQNGAALVIETGRPVLYMGGFGGQDEVVTAEDLSTMVANGELRYVLYGDNRGNKEDISSWLQASCSVVTEFSSVIQAQNQANGPGGQSMKLYICK
jgi:4-amino-4-deoxy-L-arabinose transferase-like glycosyltransferase